MAFKSARHSVGRLRNVSIKKSLIGTSLATPTSLQNPSLFSLSPFPPLIFPFDSSDVKTVSTIRGGARYILPTEKLNLALNFKSTWPDSGLIFPRKTSGKISIFRKGGKGSPKNLVVEVDSAGIYSDFSLKSTEKASSVSEIFAAIPEPVPPSALYSKSGYLEIPSLQAPKVLN